MVGTVKGNFVKLKFKVALPCEKNDLPLLKEVLSHEDFVKLHGPQKVILFTITNSMTVLNSILNFVLSLVSWPM